MQSEQIDKLAEALAKAQGEFTNPQKNKTVNVRTKTGGTYEFSYADFTAIIEAVRKPLSKHGLAYVQLNRLSEQGPVLVTKLLHSSGQWIGSEHLLLISPDGGNQNFGSATTFMKRYALTALVGISADSDDDANSADGNEATIKDRGRKPKEPAPSPMRGGPQAQPILDEPSSIGVPPDDAGNPDWLAWGREFMLQAKAASTKEAAFRWLTLNQDNLIRMEVEAEKMFPKLKAALAGIYPVLILKREAKSE